MSLPFILLIIANCFMTLAWYGHLKFLPGVPLWQAILFSWFIVVVLTKDLCEPLYNYVVEVFKRMTANSSQLHYNRVILSTYEGVRFEVVLSAYSEQDLYCLYRC
jgi:hypothetical protein